MIAYATLEFERARVVATGVAAGVSVGNFSSLNLADYVGDSPEAVGANIQRLTSELGADGSVIMRANHGNTVNVVHEPGLGPIGDGLITDVSHVALVALSADCVPVAFIDSVHGRIAVAHAGWKGVSNHVVTEVVQSLIKAGSDPDDLSVVVGPAICGECYEVAPERVDTMRELAPASVVDETHLDLVAGVRAELAHFALEPHVLAGCTREDPALFSYRRAHGEPTGRNGLAVMLKH